MTKDRHDNHSTEFGLWLRNRAPDKKTILRNPDPLDSSLGYVASNLDYIWRNYKSGDGSLIEEKRYGADCDFSQKQTLNWLDQRIKKDAKYHGLHKLVFENTNPEDGKMWLDDEQITKTELIEFLTFRRI